MRSAQSLSPPPSIAVDLCSRYSSLVLIITVATFLTLIREPHFYEASVHFLYSDPPFYLTSIVTVLCNTVSSLMKHKKQNKANKLLQQHILCLNYLSFKIIYQALKNRYRKQIPVYLWDCSKSQWDYIVNMVPYIAENMWD